MIRKFFLPMIPPHLFNVAGIQVTSNMMTMVLFALMMLMASYSMIKDGIVVKADTPVHTGHTLKLLGYGVGIGLATGLLGAGGGFLLIPTLVMLLRLPMKEAVGTSLMVIAMNSLIGFTGDLGNIIIDWYFLIKVTGMAIAGVLFGIFLSTKIDGSRLKRGFGWFVLVMGGYILQKELLR